VKRLLIFHPALAPYRVDFFNELGRRFNLKIVFLVRNNLNQGFQQEILLKNATYSYEYLDQSITIFKRRLNRGYWKIIKNFNPDIVFTSEFGASLIGTWSYKILHRSTYKIFTLCDDSIEIFNNCKGIRKYSRSFFYNKINGIICVNPTVAKGYSDLGAQHTIYFPIIREENSYKNKIFSVRHITKDYIYKWNLAGKINIMFVGRLATVKNLDGLLLTFSKLPVEYKQKCNLIFVGEGTASERLLKIAQELGLSKNLLMVGKYENEELLAWYNIGSFFVLPSLYEPFGAVTGEALMAGMPALISSMAGSSCLIDNTNGLVFNPINENDFLNSLISMIARSETTPVDGFIRSNLIQISFSSYMNNLENILNNSMSDATR